VAEVLLCLFCLLTKGGQAFGLKIGLSVGDVFEDYGGVQVLNHPVCIEAVVSLNVVFNYALLFGLHRSLLATDEQK
jgi:hypothetical protein